MSDDLVAFLRARLDEREAQILGYRQLVRDLQRGLDRSDITIQHELAQSATMLEIGGEPALDPGDLWRAEIECPRRIVDRAAQAIREQGIWGEDGQAALGEDVLCLLALRYDQHPDYREEWRP